MENVHPIFQSVTFDISIDLGNTHTYKYIIWENYSNQWNNDDTYDAFEIDTDLPVKSRIDSYSTQLLVCNVCIFVRI